MSDIDRYTAAERAAMAGTIDAMSASYQRNVLERLPWAVNRQQARLDFLASAQSVFTLIEVEEKKPGGDRAALLVRLSIEVRALLGQP